MDPAATYKPVLERRKAELDARLHRIENELDAPQNPDNEERASETQDSEVLEGVGQAGLAELKAIEAALVRIENGSYGICVKCGEPISDERLKAVPHAAICENCIR